MKDELSSIELEYNLGSVSDLGGASIAQKDLEVTNEKSILNQEQPQKFEPNAQPESHKN